MNQQVIVDPDKTAVLIMDFQTRIVNNYASDPQGVVQSATQVLKGARQAGIPVIYVVHRGRGFEESSTETDIHPGVSPASGETIISKTKTSPFSNTGLDALLREMGRDTLVLMGVSTSGCVLSTIRWAADIGFKLVVVADACSDPDPEVHRVLMEKIYPRQASVMVADDVLRAANTA